MYHNDNEHGSPSIPQVTHPLGLIPVNPDMYNSYGYLWIGCDGTLPTGCQGYTEQFWWDCWGNWQPPQPEVMELNMPVQDPVPGPSSLIQPAQEGPRQMSRVRQPQHILCFPGKLKEEWRQVCTEEISTLRKCSVFELVALPKSKKAIGNRWVFDIKSDCQKHACLVAKGFL